jgi:NarL family two-component system sensor histidine kinase LiaS
MRSFVSFFQRLQWKLTLSYAVVTAGTVVVLAGLLVGLVIYIDSRVPEGIYSSFYWSKTAFQDNIPYLLDNPKALQTWLNRVQAEGFVESDFKGYTVRETMSHARTLLTGVPIFVLDQDLNIIAAAPLDDRRIIGQPYEEYAPAGYEIANMKDAMLAGDKNYYAQSYRRADGSYLAAFPLRKSDNEPVSAYVVYQAKPYPSYIPENLDIYWTFFIVTAALMLVLSLPVGAVFGWLASRGLRRRMTGLSSAAQAWSRGDLNARPSDRSGDEIGELTRNLNKMAEQLRTHMHTRDELARVEERNRLARDLHDTVKQQTYAARMQLTAAKNLLSSNPQVASEHLEAALQLNRETQQELKLIIDELRPAALQGRGLAQALQEYAARWQEHTGIRADTVVSGERPLSLDVEQALYRVLQESLSNVARHAEASEVEIKLNMTTEQVVLSIADNGRGFDQGVVTQSSFGLAGMKQRLGEVGGTLAIESAPGNGSTVTAQVKTGPQGSPGQPE